MSRGFKNCYAAVFLFVYSVVIVSGQYRPPRITEHPSDILVRKSDPATLNCKAEGNPEPTIQWYHNGALVKYTSNRMNLTKESLFFLEVLRNKREQVTGTYWCVATNELGQARSKNATLEVATLRDDFRVLPKSVEAAAGDSATIECNPPKGHPEPLVKWKKDGEIIDTTKGRLRVVPPGNLFISEVQQSDEGRYVCIAENMAGRRETLPIQLSVHVKPFFIKEPEHLTVTSNVDAVFECRVDGFPQPTVTWHREDDKMPVGRASVDDKNLIIRNVTPEDDGTYVCEAKNSVGEISSSVSLTVHSRPKFLSVPKDQRANVNSNIKFNCKASGNPPPSVFWTKEGSQVLMFPERTYGRFSVNREGTLFISNVKKEDRGYYICSVLSGIGSTMAKAHLDVTATSDNPAPIIRFGPANQTLPLNTVALLPCEAFGDPPPTVRWSINSVPLMPGNPRFVILDSGTLQIDGLQPGDSGIYTCTASSESGETSWNASLFVESPHNPNAAFHKMPDFSKFPAAPSKPAISNVTETTVALSWRRSSRVGVSNFKGYIVEYYSSDLKGGWNVITRHIPKEMYTASNLRPDTRYMFLVRAENLYGIGPPSPISDIVKTHSLLYGIPHHNLDEARSKISSVIVFLQDVIPVSSASVKLLWKIQGASSFIEGFYIRFKDLTSNSQKYNMVTVLNGGSSHYVLSDLKKYTKYEFFLVPFYKSIEGPPSNSRVAQTLEDVPSAPPDNLHIKLIGPTSAIVSWAPPPQEHQNGRIQGYSIRLLDNSSHLHSLITTNISTTSIKLSNLTAGLVYSVKAAAFTASGYGPFSPSVYQIIDYKGIVSHENHPSSPDINDIVRQPWFFAMIGCLVFILLSVFVIILFFKRRIAWKKGLQAHLSGPVLKTEDVRIGVCARETLWINQAWRPVSSPGKNCLTDTKLITNIASGMDRSYISGGTTSDYAEVDTHNMRTFYKKEPPSVPAPYATTTLINPPNSRNVGGSIHEGKSSGSEASKKSDRMYDMETRLIEDSANEQLIEARNMVSPSSDSGSYTTDEYGLPVRRKRLRGTKGNIVNWADLIPPPPEHPPSEGGSPTNTLLNNRNYHPPKNYSQHSQENVQNIPYFPNKNQNTHSPALGKFMPNSPWSTLTRAPVDSKRAPTPPFMRIPKLPPISGAKHLPQAFGSNPVMDKGIQSSLVSFASDPYSGISLKKNNQDLNFRQNSGVLYHQLIPDYENQNSGRYGCINQSPKPLAESPETSAAEDDYAQGHAPTSSCASATERSSTSSARSSIASSSEGSVYTDSDFANAVARAAQNAGLHLLRLSPSSPSKLDNVGPSMTLLTPAHKC